MKNATGRKITRVTVVGISSWVLAWEQAAAEILRIYFDREFEKSFAL